MLRYELKHKRHKRHEIEYLRYDVRHRINAPAVITRLGYMSWYEFGIPGGFKNSDKVLIRHYLRKLYKKENEKNHG